MGWPRRGQAILLRSLRSATRKNRNLIFELPANTPSLPPACPNSPIPPALHFCPRTTAKTSNLRFELPANCPTMPPLPRNPAYDLHRWDSRFRPHFLATLLFDPAFSSALATRVAEQPCTVSKNSNLRFELPATCPSPPPVCSSPPLPLLSILPSDNPRNSNLIFELPANSPPPSSRPWLLLRVLVLHLHCAPIYQLRRRATFVQPRQINGGNSNCIYELPASSCLLLSSRRTQYWSLRGCILTPHLHLTARILELYICASGEQPFTADVSLLLLLDTSPTVYLLSIDIH